MDAQCEAGEDLLAISPDDEFASTDSFNRR